MDRYITGAVIRRLRERRKMTQEELAEKIHVSGKAVSKWETQRGLPDISLIEPLSKALGISVIELLSGADVRNGNRGSDMRKGAIYVCPVCGNVIRSIGETVVSCCGITLPRIEPEEPEADHRIRVDIAEDEYYVTLTHPMTREHYISFLAAISDHGMQFIKLYPEENAQARFKIDGVEALLAYCNRHGLFRIRPPFGRKAE